MLNDTSPPLRVDVLNGRWSESEKAWVVVDDVLHLRASPTGPAAATFRGQPGTISVFVNGSSVSRVSKDSVTIDVLLAGRRAADDLVTVNWSSDFGPLAANTIRVRRSDPKSSAQKGERGQ